MVNLRHFSREDCEILRNCRYPDLSSAETEAMISEWNTCLFNGRYFEVFAVISEGKVVGSVSVYEHSPSSCEIGPDIFPEERGKGFATEAMKLMLEHVSVKGFRMVIQQVRITNEASKRLHEKLGFEKLDTIYRNAKGNEVLLYFRIIN